MEFITALLPIIVPFVGMILEAINEDSKRRKELADAARSEVEAGLRDRDPSRITAGFDSANRM
jgi:hypothetical protein